MKRILALVATALFGCVAVMTANAHGRRPPVVTLGINSEQAGPSRVTVVAGIGERGNSPGRRPEGSQSRPRGSSTSTTPGATPSVGGAVPDLPPAYYPSIPSNSKWLESPQPRGPETFWYSDGSGHVCIYIPNGSSDCYTPTGGNQTPAPPVDPAGVAASISSRLVLQPGRLEASPSASGVTGLDSWFWLDPAPQPRQLSVSLGAETVTVTAEPEIEWRFGDGEGVSGGAGVRYQPGRAPAEAILHVYQTRCLAGDQGRNPFVLASCGAGGYGVAASVIWRISYEGTGPVAQSGALPARTTVASIAYPVREARAFLIPSGGT
jgi:hypothetical protein